MTPRKRRALLAWEGGSGRGHLVTLTTVAQALGDRFVFDAAFCRLEYAPEVAPYCEAVFQAAYLPYDKTLRSAPDSVWTATWGEFMGDLGFRDAAFLARQIAWWRETLRARRISLLVADFAPCALLAARSWGVPCVAIGTGYGLPAPGVTQFPVFLPEYDTRLHDEAAMVAAVNEAGGPLGVPTIAHLPQVYTCDVALHRSFPLLDPYGAYRTAPPVPPVAGIAGDIARGGDEIFIYFSSSERDNAPLMDAVASLGARARMFMPNIDDALAARMTAAGVRVERQPVAPGDIIRRSRLLLNGGQHGTVSLGLAAGLPQVCFPQHLEQMFNARQVERAGAALAVGRKATADEIRTAIATALDDEAMSNSARELASEVRPFLAQDARDVIKARLAGV